MEIGETLAAASREAWRAWLEANHDTASSIWLAGLAHGRNPGAGRLAYIAAVEEALCFGWIDGHTKKLDSGSAAVRFSPRRAKSHWTELNKERARRMIAAGRMTPAGLAVVPDLSPEAFIFPEDVLAALRADAQVWENYQRFPELYRRIRVAAIDEVRRQPGVFQRRLETFIQKTRENKMYGVWE